MGDRTYHNRQPRQGKEQARVWPQQARVWPHRYSLPVVSSFRSAVDVLDVVVQGEDVGAGVRVVWPSESMAGTGRERGVSRRLGTCASIPTTFGAGTSLRQVRPGSTLPTTWKAYV